MLSGGLRRIKKRSHQLRVSFLPRRFSKTGSYSLDVLDRAAAFRIMFCAELETYFETLAAEIVDGAQALWLHDGTVNHALACLIGTCKDGPAIPSKIDEIDDENSYLSELIRKACGIHRQTIKINRGTKDFNVLRLFVPVGLAESKIDIELLAECNAVTALRGDVAHNAIDHATHIVDPRTEYERYLKILHKLKAFDSLVAPLKSGLKFTPPPPAPSLPPAAA